ncbi:MAG: hemerythrin domain-containing protein [Actinobacteria bacterium]|nr:hemerythrin domain-containing protein [Actinomycetota bacterium]
MTVSQQPSAASAEETIDFTMMYVTHAALRRDLSRLEQATRRGAVDTPGVQAGWQNFKQQLHIHHTVEDDDLWPRLYEAVGDDRASIALLEEMEAEHAVIDPLLEAVDQAIATKDPSALAGSVAQLAEGIDMHLAHEEDSGLPLIQANLTRKDWKGFGAAMRRAQGYKGAAVYVPWILDGASEEERRRFFGELPPPVRILNSFVWQRGYQKRGLWR